MCPSSSKPSGGKKPLQSLQAGIGEAAKNGPPPVHLWNPPYCGDIGLAIATDGTWSYRGSPIGRMRLVKLFASVLRRDDDGEHYLVTPIEKIGIVVDDVPFVAVELRASGTGADQRLALRTNLDDWVEVDADYPLRFVHEPEDDGFKPYVRIRGRLEARLSRALVYELIECAVSETFGAVETFGVWSNGTFFPIAPAARLESV